MTKFFYDSLETLQKVSFPTKKDYINLTIGVFVTVILSGLFFIGVDSLFNTSYKALYSSMRGNISSIPQDLNIENIADNIDLSGITINGENATVDDASIEVVAESGNAVEGQVVESNEEEVLDDVAPVESVQEETITE